MFWTSFAEPYLANDLLNQPDLTIQQLLDDNNILQRCREKDVRLVDFLCRDENVEYLVGLICNPLVPNELDTELFRYPSLACEIVTSDIDRLLDCIVQPVSSGTPVVDQNGSSMLPDGLANQSGMVIDAPSSSPVSCSYGGDEARQSKSDSDMSLSSPVSTEATFKANSLEKNVVSHPDTRSSVLDESSTTQPRPRLDRLLAAVKSSLNPLSASFLSRVLVHLAVHRGQVVIPYMRSYPDFLEHLLSHFDLAAIPDLVIQLAQQERGLQHSIFEWFIESRLVPNLIKEFAPTNSWEIHQSVAHCLIQLITILRSYLSNNAPPCGPDSDTSAVFDSGLPATSPYAMLVSEDEKVYAVAAKLLDILESEETVNAILDHLTNSNTVTTSIAVNCIEVLIALMDKRRPETSFPVSNGDGVGGSGGSGMEFEPVYGGNLFGGGFSSSGPNEPVSGSDPNRLGTKSDLADKARIARARTNLANAVRPRLGQLHTLLQTYHPQTCNQMPTTVGLLDPPLGRFRLALVQFFALLVALPTEAGLAEGLVNVGVVNTLLELFERYAYNTLLHQAAINFLLGVFTHARVVDANRANRKDQKEIASDPNITTSTPAGENPSDPKANPITSESPSSVASKETRMDVDADVTSSAQLKSVEKSTTTLLDDAFATIMKGSGLIDWCLRLSPLSANLPSKNNLAPINTSKPRPKPGYAGHLWQLANVIEEARKGSRSDFVARVFQELTPTTLASWDAFVAGDLSSINAQQVPDDLSDVKPSQGSNLVSLLAPNNLMGNLLSQSGGLFNVGSGLMNSGKFSLFLAPLMFGNQSGCKQNVIRDAARLDLPVILDDEDFGQTNLSTIESSPGEPRSTNMWIDDETNDGCEANARLSDSKFSPFTDNEANSGFHRARVEDLSSDESEPGEDEDADDEDDEEEDLKSPAVIKQQRSAVTPPAPVIKLSQPSSSSLPTELSSDSALEGVSDSLTPWDSALNVESAQPATDPGGWAKFDDQPIIDPSHAKESLISPSSDAFSVCQTVNGFNGSTSASTALSSSGPDSAKINQTGPSKNCPSIAPSDALQLQQQ